MTAIRVVFDTNILFSGTGWRGSPFYCLKLAREGKVNLLVCREILAEYHGKLQTKLDMTPTQATRAIAEILSFSTFVEIDNTLHVIAEDPDDDKVVEYAIAGNADFIVSGDRHLLNLGNYQGISILRANVFLERVREN